MAKSGPPKKPTKLKLLEGNPGGKPLPTKEPEPTPVCGVEPPELVKSGKAREVWDRVVPELEALGMLTVVDLELLVTYCKTWETYHKAQEFLDRHGHTWVKRDNDGNVGSVTQFPQVAIARNAAHALRLLASEFGFSPGARPSLEAKKPKGKKKDVSEFFG